MTIYRPQLVQQGDGSEFQWQNCTMASAAMALDRHTKGKLHSTGAKMRACQNDQSGGTDLMDAKVAWDNCYNQYLDVRLKITWETFIGAIKAGRGAILVGWYSYLPAAYRAQTYSNFGHAVYINEVRASDGALLMYDPLNKIPLWTPQKYLKDFAAHMKISGGNTIGYGFVQTAFTQITTPVVVVPPAPPKPKVVLRYKGVKITPNMFEARVPAKQRRSPFIRRDNIIRTVKEGTNFKAYQKTTKGTKVGASSVWYGNINGTIWMHKSVLRDI